MASGTINGTTSNQYIESRIVWSSYISGDNTSTVTAALYYRRTNTGYITSGIGVFRLAIGGNVAPVNSFQISISTEWVKASEWTTTIAHDADGSKQIRISCSIGNIDGTSLSSTNCSETVKLDTIANNTLVSHIGYIGASEGYLNEGFTYTLTSRSVCYTRAKIYVKNPEYGNRLIRTIDYGQIGRNVERTENITFSESELATIYNTFPETLTAPVIVIAATYTDASYTKRVGSDAQKSINMYIPKSVGPVAYLKAAPVNSNSWFKEKGLYVAGYSGLTATFSEVRPGDGAWMSSYSIAGGGYSSNSSTLSVDRLLKPDNFLLIGTVIDSRARSGIATRTIVVERYAIPAVRDVLVERGTYTPATATWTADDNGPDVRVYFETALALVGHGNIYTVSFTLDGAAKTPDTGNSVGLQSGIGYNFHFLGIDSEHSHALVISAVDSAGYGGSATIIVPTTHITMEFNASGKGIAFGKTSEKDAFECDWDAEFGGTMTIGGNQMRDFVIEHDTDGIWIYRKWASGMAECWGAKVFSNLTLSTQMGSGFLQDTIFDNFPSGLFVAEPMAWLSLYGNGTTSVMASKVTQTELSIRILGFTQTAAYTKVQAHAIGRWK